MTKSELASWLRHINKQQTRKKFSEWYARQPNKARSLVRKVFDLVHWDVVLDGYELDDLLVRYPDPPESEVADALVECGYPRACADARAKQPIVESRGLRYTGGHYDLRKRNPYVKYWTTYRVI